MIKTTLYQLNPLRLIDEIKKRPGLYRTEQPADREEKLQLWKEVGEAIYEDWDSFNKATAYDREHNIGRIKMLFFVLVLQLQRKWRSLRDAYNRELRARRAAPRANRRVYIYFKRMSFLGGFEGSASDGNDDANEVIFANPPLVPVEDPLFPEPNKSTHKLKKKRRKKYSEIRHVRHSTSEDETRTEEVELPSFSMDVNDEGDSDKLFLMSFLPEMKQLPANIKMWARAQIANVMQEAVTCHFNNSMPSSCSGSERNGIVKQRRDSSEHFEENII